MCIRWWRLFQVIEAIHTHTHTTSISAGFLVHFASVVSSMFPYQPLSSALRLQHVPPPIALPARAEKNSGNQTSAKSRSTLDNFPASNSRVTYAYFSTCAIIPGKSYFQEDLRPWRRRKEKSEEVVRKKISRRWWKWFFGKRQEFLRLFCFHFTREAELCLNEIETFCQRCSSG